MAQYSGYGDVFTADTSRYQSPHLWAPLDALNERPTRALSFFDDFVNSYDVSTASALTKLGPYAVIADTAGTFVGGVVPGGMQTMTSGTTADGDVVMTLGGGSQWIIGSAAANKNKLVFEARLKVSSITSADEAQFFIGLTEEDRAVDGGLFSKSGTGTANTALADIDMIGFARFDDAGTDLAFVYSKAGQTAVEVIGAAATLAADTFVKVGFTFDGNKIVVYVNGVPNATVVGADSISAATFPDGEELTMSVGMMSDSTTSNTLTLDWWGCSQAQ